MAPSETEDKAYAKFWGENKEHYGMLWYFLEWLVLYFRFVCRALSEGRMKRK